MDTDDDYPTQSSRAIVWVILMVVLILLGVGAYWFAIRPAHIRHYCANYVTNANAKLVGAPAFNDVYGSEYAVCTNSRGLN